MDLTIEGKAYINGAFEQCCIGISEGKIVSIKKVLRADDHLNFGHKLLLPAGIDCHVHFRDPGFTHKEDFFTGSCAAAFGGLSCIFDMPNTNPPSTTVNALREKKQQATRQTVVDFGVYAALTDDTLTSLPALSPHCHGFKIFLGSSTNSLLLNEKLLSKALHQASQEHKPTFIHAESEQCLQRHTGSEHTLKDHLQNRPSRCEEQAIVSVLNDLPHHDSQVHICHVSSCEGVELVKKNSKRLSAGVTPHHLFFDIDTAGVKEQWLKVNPPLRTGFDREALWHALQTGVFDMVESDHAPHTLEEKDVDFDKAPSGIPGVETLYPLLLAQVKQDRLSFQSILSLLCERPAEFLHLPKGKLEVGRDADLAVVDFKHVTKVDADLLHSKCGWTPFEGFPALFPSDVFVRGERIIEEKKLVASKGFGACV
jgi:dihydroorotase